MKRFLHDSDGATAIEYALIASLIGFVIIGALTSIGGSLTDILNSFAGVF
ncbi:MAG: Flp family type IVb pilin [Hyphomonadaceae bacterium]